MRSNIILIFLASLFLVSIASAGYSWDGQPYTIDDDKSMRDYNGLYNESYWAYYSAWIFSFNVSDVNASDVTLFFHHNITRSGLFGGQLRIYNFTAETWYVFPFESFDVAYYGEVWGVGAGLYYQNEPYLIGTALNGDDYYVCPNSTLPSWANGTSYCLYDGKAGAYADQFYDGVNQTYFLPSYFGKSYFTLSSDFWDENGVMRVTVDYNALPTPSDIFLTELLPYSSNVAPEITLVSPINNSNLTTSPTNFQFVVTDNSFVENVTFKVNGEVEYIDESHTNGTYIIGFALDEGLNNWSVSAYDDEGASSESEVWFFNYTAPEEVVIVVENQEADIRGIMESSGAGLGIFMVYLSQSLPILLIGLAMVGIIILVGYAVAQLIIKFQSGLIKK